jgi:hypothetical protein
MTLRNALGGLALDANVVAAVARLETIRDEDRRNRLTYYSEQGVAFAASTAVDAISSTGEQSVAAFTNPSGSGKNVLVWLGEFGASANVTFRRYRGSAINVTGAADTNQNMGGLATAASARLYSASAYTVTTPGFVNKTLYLSAFGQYVTEPRGALILRPGGTVRWTAQGPGGMGGTMNVSVYLEWAEVTA